MLPFTSEAAKDKKAFALILKSFTPPLSSTGALGVAAISTLGLSSPVSAAGLFDVGQNDKVRAHLFSPLYFKFSLYSVGRVVPAARYGARGEVAWHRWEQPV